MKRCLFITHSFPPLATAGVQRAAHFVRNLPSYGWEPTVLTVSNDPAYGSDASLCSLLPGLVRVERTPMLSPMPFFRLLWKARLHMVAKGIERALLFPDGKIGWFPFALPKALQLCRENKYDAVYTTSSPETAQLIGLCIKRRLGIPWVVDYRDEWTSNAYSPLSARALWPQLHRRLERAVTLKADRVITLSPGHTDILVTMDLRNARKYSTIENGFDYDEITRAATLATADAGPVPGSNPDSGLQGEGGVFKVVYIGALRDGLNLAVFLDACKRLIDERVLNAGRFLFCFAGYPWKVDQYRREYGQWFQYLGYLEHQEALALVHSSDLLLLLVGAEAPRHLPGKLYEYIAVNKPILALAPVDGLAAKLVERTRTGCVVAPDDTEGIAGMLVQLYEKWQKGSLRTEPDWNEVLKYERKELARKLASVLDLAAG